MSTRDELIGCLRAAGTDWISGTQLSRRLGISRAAVSKHVAVLRRGGYRIQSKPRKGYCLELAPDNLSMAEIRNGLRTRSFGRREVLYLAETDSTNTQAKTLAAAGAAEGTLVVAAVQHAGRGRRGHDWFSPPGGLYVSLVLRPRLAPLEAPKLTLLAGVAAAEALLGVGLAGVHIKWPNDLLVGRRKIAGLLTEVSMEMDALSYAVVGLGLNVNTDRFPPELRQGATSVLLEIGKPISRAELLRRFLTRFEDLYAVAVREGFEDVLNRWRALTRMLGKQTVVRSGDTRYEGTVKDIDSNGMLVLVDAHGRTHTLFSGEVDAS